MTVKQILLVDDDSINNMINTKLITKNFDCQVTTYTNAQETLTYLRGLAEVNPEDMPQVIFLDINMPVMDGWEFLEEFQLFSERALDKCSVIMLTSSIDYDDIEKSKKYSVVKDFVSKPLTSEKIRELIGS